MPGSQKYVTILCPWAIFSHIISLSLILILYLFLCLCIPNGVFPWCCPFKMLYVSHIFMCRTCYMVTKFCFSRLFYLFVFQSLAGGNLQNQWQCLEELCPAVVLIMRAGTRRVGDLGLSFRESCRRNWVRRFAMSLTDIPAWACSNPHPACRSASDSAYKVCMCLFAKHTI